MDRIKNIINGSTKKDKYKIRDRFRHTDKCINCGKCKKVCQMNIDPVENCNHLECIRCGRCKNACPVDAISYGVRK